MPAVIFRLRSLLISPINRSHMCRQILVLLFLAGVFACKAPSVSQTTQGQAAENGLLWEIRGKGLPAPSYLYGTIHMICPADFRLTDSIKASFGRSATVYLELDMDDPAMTMKTLQLAMMPKGSMKDLMSPEDYALLDRFMTDSVKMPMMLFNKMKPFTLLSVLYTKVLPCTNLESYEQRFVAMAASQKKELLGLERLEDQFAVFDQIPDTAEARMILDMVKDFNGYRREFQKMVDAYKREDLQGLAALVSSSPDLKGYEDKLLATRNRNWIPVMEKAFTKEPCFFAVGAAHLPGPDGVIQLLRQAGYEVRPVR